MRVRGLLFGGVLTFALSLAGVADACMCYPPELQTILGLSSPPQCTICHATLAGGYGTLTRNFGPYIKSVGAEGVSTSSLDSAMTTDEQQMHVSNDAGITDIAALMAGEDPNDPLSATGSSGPPQPAFGCGAHIASTNDILPAAGATGLSLLFGVVVARRARRRRP